LNIAVFIKPEGAKKNKRLRKDKTVINQSKKYELTLRFRLEVTTPNAYIQLLMGFLPARFSATLHKGEQNEE
jgi:hypothetical protein